MEVNAFIEELKEQMEAQNPNRFRPDLKKASKAFAAAPSIKGLDETAVLASVNPDDEHRIRGFFGTRKRAYVLTCHRFKKDVTPVLVAIYKRVLDCFKKELAEQLQREKAWAETWQKAQKPWADYYGIILAPWPLLSTELSREIAYRAQALEQIEKRELGWRWPPDINKDLEFVGLRLDSDVDDGLLADFARPRFTRPETSVAA